ncbi:MAG: CBASS cGAMP-activated phospholipase [Deferrisomatales bacterium]|nr:CBASS cGAMP-activated phospholipase [Deferrisomatales bacterium]
MTNGRRLLAIDGGGIKGVIPAAFLATVEDATGKRIADHFDLIAGTSTGGIIALGLGLGLPARDILDFYLEHGPRIFDQEPTLPSLFSRITSLARGRARSAKQFFGPKYNAAALAASLQAVFGDRTLGDAGTRLVIPAFDRQRRELHVFKTAHHEKLVMDWRERAVDVALATAAAPTYLPEHKLGSGVPLIDGGVWANNPTGLVVVEAIGVLNWSREDLHVLSLGCSEELSSFPENGGRAALASKVADLFMAGQSRASLGTAKLLTGHTDANRRLFRYTEVVPEGMFCLDAVGQIENLKGIGTSLARHALPEITPVFLGTPRDPFTPFRPSGTSKS